MPARIEIADVSHQRANKDSFSAKRSLVKFPYNTIGTRRSIVGSNGFMHQLKDVKKRISNRKTNSIGVVVHELHSDFIKAALIGMEAVMTGAGYEMVITHSQESMEKEVANAQLLFEQQVDGVIASLSFGTTNLDHFKPFVKQGIPVVFFDRVEKTGGNGIVVIDNVGTGYAATRHLIEQGCKRIAIITSCLERNVYADRFEGYCKALRDNGIQYSDKLLIINNLSEEAGMEAARQIFNMKERPDGLFITNDLVAAVCMQALMNYGFRVPEDIAIVGFNNDAICKLTSPTITTINYPGVEMGRVAAMNLLNAITDNNSLRLMNTAILPAELIVRHSSLKLAPDC